jgi:Domain of unknown function (DUF4386)
MSKRTAEMAPQIQARIAGVLYLIVIAGGLFAELFVRGRLVVHGDAAATAHNIIAHQTLYRWGFAVEIFYCVCNVPMTVIFYNLFKVVNRNLTLMMVVLDVVVNTIESVSVLAHIAPLLLLSPGGSTLRAFTMAQLQAGAYLSLELFEHGFAICLVFFGFDCLVMANLIYKSTFLPRVIGVLLAIEGVGYLVNSFSLFLAPDLQARIFPYFVPTALAEVALCLWLLVMGINVERWKEKASATGDTYALAAVRG